jgi:hypothetical protein
VIINLHYTHYPIMKKSARSLGWRLKRTDLAKTNENLVPPTLHAALDNY